jgi:hypothetical protein
VSGADRHDAERRVRTLVDAAARIADGRCELGRRARDELVHATRLSREGVELALAECLETRVSEVELRAFCAAVEPVRAAHVLLSANVFVAAHRAIALSLAASARVSVRPSRREPVFCRLLAQAAPGLFEIVDELAPGAGDAVWAYGSDATLAAVRASLTPNVSLHAHGSGIGVAVVDAEHAHRAAARDLALDIVLFDQRGCLSPRAVAFVGSEGDARAFAGLVAAELAELAERVPLGELAPGEAADVTRFRDALTVAGSVVRAGPGFVATSTGGAFVIAPVSRNLAVLACEDPLRVLEPHARLLAAVGFAASSELETKIRAAFPGARPSALGAMQRPPFDGPVDRRS